MMRVNRTFEGPLWWIHDILFSSTIASALTAILVFSSIYLSAQLGGWGMGLNSSFHRAPRADFGVNLGLSISALVLTVAILVVLRVTSLISRLAGPIKEFAGAIAIVVPAICFYFVQHFQPSYFLYVRQWTRWLAVEEAMAVSCVLLFLCRRWPLSQWTTVILLVLHSALWYRFYDITFAGTRPSLLVIPILALVSVMAWGFSVRRKAPATALDGLSRRIPPSNI